MNISTEEGKENDLIIKAATGNIKARTIRDFLFPLTLQACAVRLNDQGAPLLGLLNLYISAFGPRLKNVFQFFL